MGEVTNLMSVDEKQAEESWDRVDAGPVVSVKLTVGSVITGMEIAEVTATGTSQFVGRVIEGASDALRDMSPS